MSKENTEKSGTVLVSWDFSNGKDEGILLVGEQKNHITVTIVNAFKGEEAYALYEKLTKIQPWKGKEIPNA